jgi:CDP-6-deoxy-D-xylo-4-hexulose-3-dehydrase
MTKQDILDLIIRYLDNRISPEFSPGESTIPLFREINDVTALISIIDSLLEDITTQNKRTKNYFYQLLDFLNNDVKFVELCANTFSANLVAMSAITADEFKSRAVKPGDEIITTVMGFPASINSIFQIGAIPVFVDVELGFYSPNPDVIEQAISENTKVIALTYPLGNPCNVQKIKDICDEYNLWLIEDVGDGVGGTFDSQFLGSFGDLSIASFPSHHILGNSLGAIFMNSPMVNKVVKSLCNQGRTENQDNSLNYGYSRIGYDLKVDNLQSNVSFFQMQELRDSIQKRRHNFMRLFSGMQKYAKYFHLPKWYPLSDPNWFGFPLTIKNPSPFSRDQIIQFLNHHKIETGLIPGDDILQSQMYKKFNYRIFGDLTNSKIISKNSFWIGTHSGITDEMVDYILSVFDSFMND